MPIMIEDSEDKHKLAMLSNIFDFEKQTARDNNYSSNVRS